MHKSLTTISFAVLLAAANVSAFACSSLAIRSSEVDPVLVANEPNSRPIEWSSSFEAAQKIAQNKQQPYLVYFCSEDVALAAGGDELAFASYRLAHGGDAPRWTVFDCPRMTAEMMKVHIAAYVKIADTAQNQSVFKRYGVKAGTVALFTPEGEKFTDCNADRDAVLETLWSIPQRLLAWADAPAPGAASNSVAELSSKYR